MRAKVPIISGKKRDGRKVQIRKKKKGGREKRKGKGQRSWDVQNSLFNLRERCGGREENENMLTKKIKIVYQGVRVTHRNKEQGWRDALGSGIEETAGGGGLYGTHNREKRGRKEKEITWAMLSRAGGR